ncbi:MAG: type II toxin-antitoxin system PemK/MazF family toxin [Pleurocapsa sp. MO_226.B13]|nr:type II toxin-antitoxin system PemK/MazF family toxin [Pleurocapsa sp. MO_226.B13]
MVIQQGDIYWINLGEPVGLQTAYRHPHVVIQNNVFNQSRIATVIVCALTSNLKRANAPGNILLEKNEANTSFQKSLEGSIPFRQLYFFDRR